MSRLHALCDRLASIAVEDLGSDGKILPLELDELVQALSDDSGASIEAISADLRQRISKLHAAKQENLNWSTHELAQGP
jgi:hypothetical protein